MLFKAPMAPSLHKQVVLLANKASLSPLNRTGSSKRDEEVLQMMSAGRRASLKRQEDERDRGNMKSKQI